jgi:alkyldihydroxyacetonephosphate synthase
MTRARNFWAWGWADRFPDDDARRTLASHIGAMFGREPALLPLPSIDDVTLEEPRIAAGLPCCTSDRTARIFHTHGKGYRDIVRGFRLDFSRAPDVVALPESEADVEAVLAWCASHHVAAIPYGGGTSVVGGVECDVGEAYAGTCVIDLAAMNKVLEVDATSRAARIQAGAFGPRIEEQLAPHGYTLRHFPQSFEHSTLGGWIATRAGGHFATLYTHIDDLVESVRMVTSAGILQTRRLPASGAGPSPERLVLGSEGALGVITEAWMRVQSRPKWRASASVHFERFEAAMECARAIAQSGLFPANCRVLDAREALLNRAAFDGTSVVIVAFESADHALEAWMERALAIAKSAGGTCPKGARFSSDGDKIAATDAASSWRQAFLDAPYLQSALVSMGVVVDTFETACTWDRFPALHAEIAAAAKDAMMRACGVEGSLSCRVTHVYPDGPAPYFTFIAPGFIAPGRDGADVIDQWLTIKRAVSDAIERAQGTITHHHAVGRLHRPWYEREASPVFVRAFDAVKGALDVSRIMNPGVLVPARVSRPDASEGRLDRTRGAR